MRTINFLFATLVLSASVVACAGASSDSSAPVGDNVDQGSEQDLSAARTQLIGSWALDSASSELSPTLGYDFRPNGQFFRDTNRVFPLPIERETGRYSINTTNHELTLHITSPAESTEVVAYAYTAGRVLNGVMVGAGSSGAKLSLTGIAAPGSHVAFPTIKYDQVDSWCTSVTDCNDEQADKTLGTVGPLQCDAVKRVCEAAPSITCGAKTCGKGEYCCNPMGEGICAKTGEACAF